MKQKIIIILLIIFGLVFSWVFIKGKNKKELPAKLTVNKQLPVSSADVVIGVVRTTGLTDQEKKEIGLNFGDYQITDFNKVDGKEGLDGYYLETNDPQYKVLLGQCVRSEGATKLLNNDQSYNRGIFIPTRIEKNNSLICGHYTSTVTEENNEIFEEIKFTGVLGRFNRPSPEINYDYELKLDQPFIDEDNASGLPQEIKSVIVVPNDGQIWKKIEDNIDKKVNIYGYMLSGFAESRYFEVGGLDSHLIIN